MKNNSSKEEIIDLCKSLREKLNKIKQLIKNEKVLFDDNYYK